MDYSPPGSSVHGILQAGILEWVAMPSSRGSSQPRIEPTSLMSPALAGGFFSTGATWEAPVESMLLSCFSHVRLCAIPQTAAHHAPSSLGFSRQKYWSGLLCPPPGHLPNPGIEPTSLMSPALLGRFFITKATWEALNDQEGI